jgi:signal transduction histidine kinase/ActR/RegA family two-component response regulator
VRKPRAGAAHSRSCIEDWPDVIALQEVLGALDLLPEPILLLEASGRIAGVNRAVSRVLDAGADELTGRPIADIIDEPPERLLQYISSRARGEPIAPLQSLTLRPKSSAPVAFAADGSPYRANPRAPVLVMIRLQPKSASPLDDFLAVLAHELRNPLAPIRNSMQLMQASEGDVGTMSAARAIVERQIKHLSRIIDDLLDISRINRGQIELHEQPTDLTDVIHLALEISRPQLEGKQHRLQIELAREGLSLMADPARLAQAFANLLHNASKYSPAGTPIRIEASTDGGQAIVRVIDRGIGIPASMLERIFDLFEQVDRTGRGAHDGLGLGLTLAKRIVELHGGTLVAWSDGKDRGSQFTVRLPLAAQPESAITLTPPADAIAPTRRLRILVADDNRDAAQTLAMLLRLDGHDVRAVHDGAEALTLGEAFHPQLLLLDIGMPVLDGYETARQVRERPWGRKAQLVALTGWGQDSDRRNALNAGFHHHLVKPAEPDALRAVIDSIVAE